MMLVDSHCHLNYEGLRDDPEGVVARARAAGVGTFLTINTRLREYDEVVALVERFPDVFGTVGIHPHEAETGVGAGEIVARTRHPRIVGIGETGLDYHYDNAPHPAQQASFAEHIRAAQESGLPLVVHSREAEEDTARMLGEALAGTPFAAVIHCFTGSRGFMEQMVGLGFFVSISGIVTFKSARDLQETAKAIPDDRLLIETDAPFLAPVPHRGRICEPAHVADTARFLANLRGIEVEALAVSTADNFFRLFGKASRPVRCA